MHLMQIYGNNLSMQTGKSELREKNINQHQPQKRPRNYF